MQLQHYGWYDVPKDFPLCFSKLVKKGFRELNILNKLTRLMNLIDIVAVKWPLL